VQRYDFILDWQRVLTLINFSYFAGVPVVPKVYSFASVFLPCLGVSLDHIVAGVALGYKFPVDKKGIAFRLSCLLVDLG